MKIITGGCCFSKQSFLRELMWKLKMGSGTDLVRSMSTYDGWCIGVGSEDSYRSLDMLENVFILGRTAGHSSICK